MKSLQSWLFTLLGCIALFVVLSQIKMLGMLERGTAQPELELPSANQVAYEPTADRPTLVYFFAPWCSVCHLSIDNLESFYQQQTQFNVVAVALSYESPADVAQFLQQHQLTMPVLLGSDATAQLFRVQGFPSYYLFSASGVLLDRDVGYSTLAGITLRGWLGRWID